MLGTDQKIGLLQSSFHQPMVGGIIEYLVEIALKRRQPVSDFSLSASYVLPASISLHIPKDH